MLLAGRVAILWSYMALSRSSLAEKTRVVRRVVPEEQRDRESHWPLYHLVVFFEVLLICSLGLMDDIPLFNLTGILVMLVFHVTFIEFIYYWVHYAMHFRTIYKAMHKHHHRSVVTEPTTSITFLWFEHAIYDIMFALPVLFILYLGVGSYAAIALYSWGFDVFNYTGHSNFEFFPRAWMKSDWKWIIYTPSYHSIHHTNPYHNYSLFLPWTDVLFGTVHQKTTERFEFMQMCSTNHLNVSRRKTLWQKC